MRFGGKPAQFFVNVTNLFANRWPLLVPETGMAANTTPFGHARPSGLRAGIHQPE